VSGFGLAAGQFGSPWTAPEPLTREVLAARVALTRGLAALRGSLDEMRSVGARPEGGSTSRIRTRLHGNDGSTRHQPAGSTTPVGGRVPSARQPSPAELNGPTVDPAIANAQGETETLPTTGSGHFPSRPEPGDPANEVWSLVERAQNGEAEAFGLIYDRYLDTVFRFIYFRVGNRQLAEDLTSDTFLRALKRIGSFTWQGRDLGAWLVTIARNLVADHFKSGRYRLEVTTGDVLDADREDRGPEGSPEAAVVDHITNVTLLSAVKQLNPEQQECIVLRFLQGFSVAETAQSMGKNEGAIKALQYRAVRALARLLPEGFQQ
jgi:RNA polymerase sigma-70 factor, ECF subfamily